MNVSKFEELAADPRYATLLRFICAAPDGIDPEMLSGTDRKSVSELLVRGAAIERDGRVVAAMPRAELNEILRHFPGLDDATSREISGLLSYLQELTGSIINTRSVPDLFRAAFQSLATAVEFDLAAAVLIEQNLDLFLSRRENFHKIFNEHLDEQIREILQKQIPVTFSSTDVVLQSDFADLPAREEPDDVLAHRIFTLIRQEHRPAGVLIVYRGDRDFLPAEQRVLDFFANQISIILGSIRAHEQIQALADTDDMTGIWNKRYFRRQLPSEVERSRIYQLPLSLVMFDVDNFKEINDSYGHPIGDVVLSELCGTVRESLRQPDLFARFGGDEFAIILPHTDYAGAERVATRILERVRSLNILSDAGTQIRCSLSIGIATYVPPDMSANDLLRHADERLYSAKKSGKNRYA